MKGGGMGYGMRGAKPGSPKKNPVSKGALPGIAKGGGTSGGNMKGGGGIPKMPGAAKPKAR